MTFERYVVLALLLYCVVREYMFWIESHKLIDKLMSKNFYDYETTKNPQVEQRSAPSRVELQEQVGPDVDHVMQGMF